MKKSPTVDFKGLIGRYKSIFTNHMKSVIAAIALFAVEYLLVVNAEQLPKGLTFLSAIGGFLLAAGFCLLVLLFIVPIFGFVVFPLCSMFLNLLIGVLKEINTPIKNNADSIQKDTKW